MEARPRRPWLTPAEVVRQGRLRPAGAPKPAWWTGTIDDQFTQVYMSLSSRSVLHRSYAPDEVDLMDLTTIWALMGIGKANQLKAEQIEATRASDPEVTMLPLTDEEKAERLARRRAAGGRTRRIRTEPR